MTDQLQATVIKAHQRTYDDPITLVEGDAVTITRRELWDDQYPWVWCISDAGKEGWVPEGFVRVQDDRGIVQRDYNAIELTISVGEKLIVQEETHGWYWVENVEGQQGWIPRENVLFSPG